MKKLDEFQTSAVEEYLEKRKSNYTNYEFDTNKIKFDVNPYNIFINLSKMAENKELKVKNITDCINEVINIIGVVGKPNIKFIRQNPYLDWELQQRTMLQKVIHRHFFNKKQW